MKIFFVEDCFNDCGFCRVIGKDFNCVHPEAGIRVIPYDKESRPPGARRPFCIPAPWCPGKDAVGRIIEWPDDKEGNC